MICYKNTAKSFSYFTCFQFETKIISIHTRMYRRMTIPIHCTFYIAYCVCDSNVSILRCVHGTLVSNGTNMLVCSN